jgi:Svf1-like C-terminal lipocalin-like domain/Svf1-like N-terminal lipocalin domain
MPTTSNGCIDQQALPESDYQKLSHPENFRWLYSGNNGKIDASIVTEGRSHYFLTKRGEFIFVQVIYANLAIKPSFQVSVRYYSPIGAYPDQTEALNLFYSDNYTNCQLSGEDGVSGKFGPLVYGLDLPTGAIQMVYANERIFLRLKCAIRSQPFQVGDAAVIFKKKKNLEEDGTIHWKYLPHLICHGEIHIKEDPDVYIRKRDISGVGCMGYCAMKDGLKPYSSIQYSNYCVFRSEPKENETSLAFSILTFEPNESYTKCSKLNQGLILVNDEVWGLSSAGNTIEYGTLVQDPVSGYKIPSTIKYNWEGTSVLGKEIWNIQIMVKTRTFLDKIDLLGKLPTFLSTMVRIFITNPWAFLFLEPNQTAIVTIPSLGLHASKVKGIFYHEITYYTQPKKI